MTKTATRTLILHSLGILSEQGLERILDEVLSDQDLSLVVFCYQGQCADLLSEIQIYIIVFLVEGLVKKS